MGLWAEHVVPRLADLALRGHEVGERRGVVSRGLSGRVLQPGFGSGLDLRFLPDSVSEVGAVEPSDVGWWLSERRRARSTIPVHRIGLDGQLVAADDNTYDAALITFALCTIPDPMAALAEVIRLVRPGGTLAFIEHGISPDPRVARLQRLLDGLQQHLAGGCHLTRDPVSLVQTAGFEDVSVKQEYLPGPRIGAALTWLSYGTAQVPAG